LPYGIIANVCAVFIGGMLGGLLGDRIPQRIKESLTLICAFSSMAIGILLTIRVNTMGVVCLALLLGTLIGELLHLEEHVKSGFSKLNVKLMGSGAPDEGYMSMFLAVLVLCCTSGTGIFGALNQGMTGDSSVLLAKAILDFFTMLIFGTSLGKFCSVIAVPQAIIFMALFFCAKLIMPVLSDDMIGDFSAVGGVISIITCFRVAKVKDMRIINVLPSLIIVFPITLLWQYLPF
jgi:hypothetical protein